MNAVVGDSRFRGVGALRRFYFHLSVACAATAFAGFLPTYWWPMANGTLSESPMVHLHGAIFFAWTLYFVMQTGLAATGRVALHRETGLIGVALATAVVFSGMLVTMYGINVAEAEGFGEARARFAITPFSSMLFFAVLIVIALVNVRRPDVHRRAMLLATVSLLQAPVARWFLVLLRPADSIGPPPVSVSLPPGAVIDLFVVAAIVHDWRTRGRPHPLLVWGGAALLAMQVLRVPLSETAAWLAIADALAALLR